jgi:methylenetetrahydrofolate reductase (NADPH)
MAFDLTQFSIEVTRPTAAEVTSLTELLPRGTWVYFSAVPTVTPQELVTAAKLLRKGGLEPVIHIAARRIPAAADLQNLIAGLRAEADVRRLLVIGGDIENAGEFADALAVIQKGRLREAGIEEIGIAGYPEGHARIPSDRLEAALDQKIAAARAAGLRVHIASQFSFSPEPIVAWLKRLRACGISLPVQVGMAGPTSLTSLLKFAKRCGVSTSMRGLTSGVGAALLGNVGPEAILAALIQANGIGDAAPHYFSFGGVLQTARYAQDVAAGRLPGVAVAPQSKSA